MYKSYVPKDISLYLNQIGFDGECIYYYIKDGSDTPRVSNRIEK